MAQKTNLRKIIDNILNNLENRGHLLRKIAMFRNLSKIHIEKTYQSRMTVVC